jgi:hypothetical protein
MSVYEKKKDAIANLIREDKKEITREDYFRFITHTLDDYSDLSFTPEEAEKLQSHLQKLSTGSTATSPMICLGPMCIVAARCPLQQMGKAPIGKICLIEAQILNHWVMQYMDEYEVDPENFTEVSMCNEMAEIEMLLNRLNMALARPENAELIIDQAIGVDNSGEPIIQKQLSPYMIQKEKLLARKAKLVKLMVGDRQEKYKKEAALKKQETLDPSSKQAEMRRKIDQLARSMEKLDISTTDNSKPKVLTPDEIIASIDD